MYNTNILTVSTYVSEGISHTLQFINVPTQIWVLPGPPLANHVANIIMCLTNRQDLEVIQVDHYAVTIVWDIAYYGSQHKQFGVHLTAMVGLTAE